MAQVAYVQTFCVQCRATVQVPTMGSTPCPYCGIYNGATVAAPQPPGLGSGLPIAAPAMPQAHGYSHVSAAPGFNIPSFAYSMGRGKIIGIVAGGLLLGALAVAGVMLKDRFWGKKGQIGYGVLAIDRENADPDLMISAMDRHARRWKRDAVWWSANISGVRPDGTVDLTSSSTASVRYISPSRVQSMFKQRRRDSIKEFSFTRSGVSHRRKQGVLRRWRNVTTPPTPTCTIKQLAQSLRGRGFAEGMTIRVSFDPAFAYGLGAPAELSWRVHGPTAELSGWFSMASCALTKAASSQTKS